MSKEHSFGNINLLKSIDQQTKNRTLLQTEKDFSKETNIKFQPSSHLMLRENTFSKHGNREKQE